MADFESGGGNPEEEDPLEKLRRMRLQQQTQAGGDSDIPGGQTEPVGPTGPVGPSAGYKPTVFSNLKGPDARDRDAQTNVDQMREAGPTGPVGPVGPQGPLPLTGPNDQYTALQALGSVTIQSPDAQTRNTGSTTGVTTGTPTPPGITGPSTPPTGANIPTGNTTPGATTAPLGGGSAPGSNTQKPGGLPGQGVTPPGGGKTGGATGGTPPPGAGTPGGGVENLGGDTDGLTGSIVNQLNDLQNQIGENAPADVGLLYSKSLQGIMNLLNSEEQRLRANAEKAGTTLDPATEFTLSKMREELDRQLKNTQMRLNARGLYDSGILVQAEQELSKGNLSDQAMVLSTRLSKIQDDLQKALTSLSNRRLDVADEYTRGGLEGQIKENNRSLNRGDDLRNALLQGRMGLRGQLSGEAQNAAEMRARAEEAFNNRTFNSQQANLDRLQKAGEGQAGRDLERELLDRRLAAEAANKNSSGGGSTSLGGGTASKFVNPRGQSVTVRRDGTTDLGDEALSSFAETYRGADADTAVSALQQKEQELLDDGVSQRDIQRLWEYVINNFINKSGVDKTGVTHGV